jgi:hypothetical protein
MLASFATGVVANQALPGIELETEFAQTRQREVRNLRYHHLCRPMLRHPDRQLRQRAVRLADGQSDFVAVPIAPGDKDRFPATRMEAITNDRLSRLIVGIGLILLCHKMGRCV